MTFQMDFLGKNMGLPTFDRVITGRLWAFKRDNDTSEWGIYYSDDSAQNWMLWHVPSVQPQGQRGPYLHKDRNDNFYFQSGSQYGRKFYRVNAKTKETTKVIDFIHVNYGIVDIYPWSFSEDAEGVLFVGQYHLSTNGAHYIYKSIDGGVTWETLDILVLAYPESRHVHSIHVNPFNNKLYIQIGDTDRRFLVSSDKLQTYSEIGASAEREQRGNTGLTFTSEAVYSAQDAPGSNNYLWRSKDDIEYVKAWTPPPELIKTPIYYSNAVGDNEIWLSFVDDIQRDNLNSAIVKLTKNSGLNSQWQYEIVDIYAGAESDNSNWYALASNGQGLIPTWSEYIYAEKCWWDSTKTAPKETGIYRIKRQSLISPIPIGKGVMVRNGVMLFNQNGKITRGKLIK